LPFGKGTTGQKNCDKIFSHYIHKTGRPVSSATILKMETKETDAYLNEKERNFLFEAAQIITFAGLAKREFFDYVNYWNADHFYFVIHQFTDDPEGVTTSTRRRDGQTTTYYSYNIFSERIPAHVNVMATCKIDTDLVNALLRLRKDHPDKWTRFSDAIFFFNHANTDSFAILPQQEVVMLLGAFQRLVDCRSAKEDELTKKFVFIMGSTGALPLMKSTRSLKQYQKRASTIREAWIRDFYRLRGDLAHGKTRSGRPLAWTMDEHLLLASFVFPLIVKKFCKITNFTRLLSVMRFASKLSTNWPSILSEG